MQSTADLVGCLLEGIVGLDQHAVGRQIRIGQSIGDQVEGFSMQFTAPAFGVLSLVLSC